MDENEFLRSLHAGLGRAILLARDHDVRPFRALILDACLNCYAIDPQSEGTRADYMFDLVSLLPDKKFYWDAVLNALANSGDDWHAKQRFHFAALLAIDGDERAKRLMYESFNPGPSMGEAIAIEFLNLDGMAGLLFAAEKLGKLLIANPDGVDLGWLMSVAKDNLGEQKIWDALRAEATGNPLVKVYLSAVEMSDVMPRPDTNWIRNATFTQLKAKLPMKMRTHLHLRSWGERATDEDLLQAAHGLSTAPDAAMQLALLPIFWNRRFPLDHNILFELAQSSHERVQWGALKALAQITGPAVRTLAFELVLTHAKWRSQAIDLLRENFQPGDHDIVLNWFETEDELETLHTEGRNLIAFWEKHPSEVSCTRMLCNLYEKGPCSFCRERTVELLLQRNAMSADMRAECTRDANFDIRELVKTDRSADL
jgi:hypothetical protein